MTAKIAAQLASGPLGLSALLALLRSEGRITEEDQQRLARMNVGSVNPLVFLAEQNVPDAATPGRALGMDVLLQWLGEKVGQPVFEIETF